MFRRWIVWLFIVPLLAACSDGEKPSYRIAKCDLGERATTLRFHAASGPPRPRILTFMDAEAFVVVDAPNRQGGVPWTMIGAVRLGQPRIAGAMRLLTIEWRAQRRLSRSYAATFVVGYIDNACLQAFRTRYERLLNIVEE